MIEFLSVIPKRVTNPTKEPRDNQPPENMTAITPPMRASNTKRAIIGCA
jgi:hypothetical protein